LVIISSGLIALDYSCCCYYPLLCLMSCKGIRGALDNHTATGSCRNYLKGWYCNSSVWLTKLKMKFLVIIVPGISNIGMTKLYLYMQMRSL